MKVFIVNPSSQREAAAGIYSESMLPMAPRGIAGLAAIARSLGHETFVEDQYASRIDAGAIADLVVCRNIDVLGLSCLSPSMPMVEMIVRRVKKLCPQTHITLGNAHATYFAEDLMRELAIDTIVLGEGEQVFTGLLKGLDSGSSLLDVKGLVVRDSHEIVKSEPAPQIDDLDGLPLPAWNLMNLDHYKSPPRLMFRDRLLSVQARRGCPWRCSYCSQHLFTPRIKRRSIGSVVDEIEWMLEEFGVSCFGFIDEIFPLQEEDGFEFCNLITERGLNNKVRWFSTTRPDRISLELLRELKQCGCLFILYGFESANAGLLNEANKDFDPIVGFEAMKVTREAGLYCYGVFMIGFPQETEEEARNTIKYACDLDCDVVSISRVTPYPGTPLYEQYRDIFPPDTPPWQWNNQYRPAPGESMWQLPGLSSEQIGRLLREAMIRYYLRPRMIIRHIHLGLFSLRDLLRGGLYLIKEIWAGLKRIVP